MNTKTAQMMEAMIAHAKAGNDVIPMFFQPLRGRSNTVSAAIRCATKRGLLVQNGVDGMGNPKYAAPIPAATHEGTAVVQ